MISSLLRESGRIAALRATPAGLRRLRAEAAALISKCQKYPALARRQWDALQKMAENGVWLGEDLKPYFTLVLSITDACLATADALHEGLAETDAAAGDLTVLEQATTALRSLRVEVSGVWDWLTAPPEKRPLRTNAEIRAGRARGEYISIEEAMTQAGLDPSEAL